MNNTLKDHFESIRSLVPEVKFGTSDRGFDYILSPYETAPSKLIEAYLFEHKIYYRKRYMWKFELISYRELTQKEKDKYHL